MSGLRWGFTNRTELRDGVVTKRYDGPDAAPRCRSETACLGCFAGALPVPSLLPAVDAEVLRMRHVPGRVGTDLVEEGYAEPVCRAAGALLRRVGEVGRERAASLASVLPGAGAWLVHGDFGPQNLLFDETDWTVTGLVDWEWARLAGSDERHADAAWFEFILRYHHPDAVDSLDAFFTAYGERPPWPVRHELMLRRCREVRDFATSRYGAEGHARWTERVAAAERFLERTG